MMTFAGPSGPAAVLIQPQPLHLHRDTLHANWNMTLGDGLSF